MDEDLSRDQQADEELLAHLRAVAAIIDPVPDEAVLAARSALAYLRMDAELAQLTFDSATEQKELAGVRAEPAGARLLTFQAGVSQVDVEVVADGPRRRLVGQCLPASQLEVTIRRPDDEATIATDDLGRFVLEVPAGPISLRCTWPHTDQAIETAWVVI